MVWSRSRSGKRDDRPEAGGPGDLGELGPAAVRVVQVVRRHGDAGPVALEAGALLVLQLEELQHPHLLAGARRHPEQAGRVGDHQPRGVHVEQGHAVLGQAVQEVEHVVVVDQRVSQVDERGSDLLLPVIPGHKATIIASGPVVRHGAGPVEADHVVR